MFHSNIGFAYTVERLWCESRDRRITIRLEAPRVLLLVDGARAGTRTRVQALATLGDNHYTTLASATLGLDRGINGCRC